MNNLRNKESTQLCIQKKCIGQDYRLSNTDFLRFIVLLVCLCFCGSLFAQGRILPLKLHERFGLRPDMSIMAVTDTLNISLVQFIEAFQLDRNDSSIDQQTLDKLSISLDAVYQYYSQLKFGFNDFTTLGEISQKKQIPFSKLASYLDLNPRDKSIRSQTIRETTYFDIDSTGARINVKNMEALEVFSLEQRFKDEALDFSATLTVSGILVVFLALLMTSFIISQLVLFVSKQKDTMLATVVTPIGKVLSKKENLDTDAVIAVIVAVHKHKMASIADHQIMLTWRRANINMWKASQKTELPTKTYSLLKKRR